jgi:hypothetical protein
MMLTKVLSYVMLGLSVPMFLASLKFVGQLILFNKFDPGLGMIAGACLVLIVGIAVMVKPAEDFDQNL